MTTSWTPLHDRLHQTLRHRRLLAKGQSILIAVSGGQDSLCLAKLMLDLQPKWDWQLAIAHCNHRWAVDSPHLPAHIQSLAESWHLPFYQATAPDEIAEDDREATARYWRYRVLTDLAQTHHLTYITTGHTASDRAETLLYNMVRGSGMDGLSALTWSRPLAPGITLVRPLLNVTRTETGEFCRTAHLPVWADPANDDRRYARNRIRQDILPYLKQHFNPNLEEVLATTAEVIQADVEHLETEATRLFNTAVETPQPPTQESQIQNSPTQESQIPNPKSKIQNPPTLRINRRMLQTQPLSLQRRVMRRCLLMRLPKAPTFEHIEKITVLINAPNRSQTDPFPGGAIARVNGDWIEIA